MSGVPRGVVLPSGRRVALSVVEESGVGHVHGHGGDESGHVHGHAGDESGESQALFEDEVRGIESVEIRDGGSVVPWTELALGDFHLLRALVLKAGIVPEEEVVFSCHNCGEELRARPCALLETGPWEDGEANDPELDRTLPFGEAIEVPAIPLGRVAREARSVVFESRTAGEARPLFRALARRELVIDADFVRAMGIARLGHVTDPARIARALEACSDEAFGAVTDAFLDSHYVLRLAADVFCHACKARSTVDAPAERELDRGDLQRAAGERGGAPLPPLDEFVELTHAIAEPLLAALPKVKDMLPVEVVVEDGTPAVDDGGEPLLGSYVPPPPADALVPQRPPLVTVYYRTFAAADREEPDFDWEDELRETLEHELEHHVYFLRGDDPMDAEERAEIDREAVRVIGRGEVNRRALAAARSSVPDFFARAWPLVAIAAAVLALTLAEGRCGTN